MAQSRFFFRAIPSAEAAEKTPPTRDRVIDFARAISLLMVVMGHAVMGVVAWKSGQPRIGNFLATYTWTQGLTWLFQIVPLFFFAGGAANALSWQKHLALGGTFAQWMWARIERLLRPLWIYLIVMGVIASVVSKVFSTAVSAPLLFIVTQLLWFLGSYVLVTGLTPLLRPSSKGQSQLVLILLILIAGLVDFLRFYAQWPKVIGLINFLIVWSIPAYLGAMRSLGILKKFSRIFITGVVLFNLAINSALIYFGEWPLSLVGMPHEPVTNMAPPSVVLAFHSITLVALISLSDSWLHRRLQSAWLWQKVCAINLSAMTLYLWHLPVLAALFALSHAIGLDRPTRLDSLGDPVPDGWQYVAGSALFWTIFGLGVWAIVRLLWPIEHARLPWWDSSPGQPRISVRFAAFCSGIGLFLAGSSLLVLAGTGLGGFPTRIVRYAGLPLNSAGAILILVLSAALIRGVGGSATSESAQRSVK
jgi:surface polysaccharide O-acyltransferase-like enzyme